MRCGRPCGPQVDRGYVDRQARRSGRRRRRSCGRCRPRTPAPVPPAASTRQPHARPPRPAVAPGACPPRCNPRPPRSGAATGGRTSAAPESLQRYSGTADAPGPCPDVDHHHSVEPLVRIDTDHHLGHRFLPLLRATRTQGGQRYFERGRPLSSHSPQVGVRRAAIHSRATPEPGWAARSRANPPGTSAQGWPAPNLAAIQTSSPFCGAPLLAPQLSVSCAPRRDGRRAGPRVGRGGPHDTPEREPPWYQLTGWLTRNGPPVHWEPGDRRSGWATRTGGRPDDPDVTGTPGIRRHRRLEPRLPTSRGWSPPRLPMSAGGAVRLSSPGDRPSRSRTAPGARPPSVAS
jgi:hypothetical protein